MSLTDFLFRVVLWFLLIRFPVYVLSSGPVLALAFWLREQTGMNEFYNVMAIYLPLLLMGHDSPIDASIEWWVVDVFGTVGPR